jgi:uncharacterized protein (UPF0335 family)
MTDAPGVGHNSGVTGNRLKSFVERIERLAEEKDGLTADMREVYNEAKAAGLDTKVMRKLIARRKMDAEKRDEQDALLERYEQVFE